MRCFTSMTLLSPMMRNVLKSTPCAAGGCKFTWTLIKSETGRPTGMAVLLNCGLRLCQFPGRCHLAVYPQLTADSIWDTCAVWRGGILRAGQRAGTIDC